MRADAFNQLSDAQALTATGYSTNTFPAGAAGRDLGVGEPMELAISVDVAADATTGDETYEFQLVESANENLSSHAVVASVTVPRAALVAGYQFTVPFPQGRMSAAYVGARYVLGGTTPSITVTTFIQPRSMSSVKPKAYPKGYTIS